MIRFPAQALLAVVVALSPRGMCAQGVAGSAVQGRVISAAGSPVGNARVTLTNTATGNALVMITGDQGRFAFEIVAIGGPYAIDARAIGMTPTRVADITLHLGDRVTQTLVLGDGAGTRLGAVMVRTPVLRNAGAGGPAFEISGDAVRDLPLLNRDFVGLFAMAAQATGPAALFVGGQNQRFNSIQVDGGSASDFYGVNVTPGAGAGAKALSIEALEEVRILIAPFDVRQGGFSGGLINAVTRSGTNALRGSAFVSLTRASLVGTDTAGLHAQDFSTTQFGLSVGGPIVRNRLHYFLTADLQSSATPFVNPLGGGAAVGISDAMAQRAQAVFRGQYGFDPGGPQAPVLRQPLVNVFAKLSWQPSAVHRIELSANLAAANNDAFSRARASGDGGWKLSGSGFATVADNTTLRAKATSLFGRASNELILSHAIANTGRRSNLSVPLFLVQGDIAGSYLGAGSATNAAAVATDQRVLEITDNLTWSAGSHLLTAGVQAQRLHFNDNFIRNPWGTWIFANLDSLERRAPFQYDVTLPLRPGGPIVDMTVSQYAGYVQDRWEMTDRFSLAAGIRVDVPVFHNTPLQNPRLAADTALGMINTSTFPRGNPVVSPRLGFAFVLGGDRNTMLRGGIGGFAGRPPYVWLAGAFVNTGQEQVQLSCNLSKGVPAVTTDIESTPSQCARSAVVTQGVPTINYVSPGFRFQQAWKYDVGIDHDFGAGLKVSMEFIHTRMANTLFISDTNLVEQGRSAEGRFMYGTITGTAGQATTRPTRRDATFGPVYRFENRSADRATAISTDIQKRWDSGAAIQLGYSWSSAQDLMSVSGLNTTNIAQSNPIDGTMAARTLRRSARDVPHTFVLTAIVPLPSGIMASWYLRARSGLPYAYVNTGDANADGTGKNDLLYVPRSASDITLDAASAYARLDAFIEREPCLRNQRGRIMTRNSCRNPFVEGLDARLSKLTRLWRGQAVEVTADIFNLPNLLNRSWGLVRETSASEGLELLQVSGWDAAADRPRYSVPAILPSREHIVVDASRWRLQLGARYSF